MPQLFTTIQQVCEAAKKDELGVAEGTGCHHKDERAGHSCVTSLCDGRVGTTHDHSPFEMGQGDGAQTPGADRVIVRTTPRDAQK